MTNYSLHQLGLNNLTPGRDFFGGTGIVLVKVNKTQNEDRKQPP